MAQNYIRQANGLLVTPQARVNIVVGATSTTLFTPPAGASARLVKLWVFNNNPAGSIISIGRGNFVPVFPDFSAPAGLLTNFTEEELLDYWWGEHNAAAANIPDAIVMQASVAAAAPDEIQVFATIELKDS